jgi:hypothetical protein
VDGDFDRVSRTVRVGSGVNAVARTGAYLWDAVDHSTLERRDAASGKLHWRRLLDLGVESLVAEGNTLWVGGRAPYVVAFDAPLGVAVGAPIPLVGRPISLAVGGGRLWALVAGTKLQEIDATKSVVTATLTLPAVGRSVAATADAAFVAEPTAGAVLRVDAATRSSRTIRVGATPNAVLATANGVWVAAS